MELRNNSCELERALELECELERVLELEYEFWRVLEFELGRVLEPSWSDDCSCEVQMDRTKYFVQFPGGNVTCLNAEKPDKVFRGDRRSDDRTSVILGAC